MWERIVGDIQAMILVDLARKYEEAIQRADEAYSKFIFYMESEEAKSLREANEKAQYAKQQAHNDLKRLIG